MQHVVYFVVAVAIAAALLGVAAQYFGLLRADAPLDAAYALAYVSVRPVNDSAVWIGVTPAYADVYVEGAVVGGAEVPVGATAPYGRTVWLNRTDGRPLTAGCWQSVDVVVSHGSARRALSFVVQCPTPKARVTVDYSGMKEFAKRWLAALAYWDQTALSTFLTLNIAEDCGPKYDTLGGLVGYFCTRYFEVRNWSNMTLYLYANLPLGLYPYYRLPPLAGPSLSGNVLRLGPYESYRASVYTRPVFTGEKTWGRYFLDVYATQNGTEVVLIRNGKRYVLTGPSAVTVRAVDASGREHNLTFYGWELNVFKKNWDYPFPLLVAVNSSGVYIGVADPAEEWRYPDYLYHNVTWHKSYFNGVVNATLSGKTYYYNTPFTTGGAAETWYVYPSLPATSNSTCTADVAISPVRTYSVEAMPFFGRALVQWLAQEPGGGQGSAALWSFTVSAGGNAWRYYYFPPVYVRAYASSYYGSNPRVEASLDGRAWTYVFSYPYCTLGRSGSAQLGGRDGAVYTVRATVVGGGSADCAIRIDVSASWTSGGSPSPYLPRTALLAPGQNLTVWYNLTDARVAAVVAYDGNKTRAYAVAQPAPWSQTVAVGNSGVYPLGPYFLNVSASSAYNTAYLSVGYRPWMTCTPSGGNCVFSGPFAGGWGGLISPYVWFWAGYNQFTIYSSVYYYAEGDRVAVPVAAEVTPRGAAVLNATYRAEEYHQCPANSQGTWVDSALYFTTLLKRGGDVLSGDWISEGAKAWCPPSPPPPPPVTYTQPVYRGCIPRVDRQVLDQRPVDYGDYVAIVQFVRVRVTGCGQDDTYEFFNEVAGGYDQVNGGSICDMPGKCCTWSQSTVCKDTGKRVCDVSLCGSQPKK